MRCRQLAFAAALLSVGCASSRTPSPAQGAAPAAAVRTPAQDPSSLRYAAGTVRYLIEQSSHAVQEVMGQSIPSDQTSRQLLSMVTTGAGSELAVAITVDSLTVSGTLGTDPGPLAALRGQTFRMVMAPSGLVVSVTAPDTTSAEMRQGATGLRDFLPPLPPSPIAAGQTWTDTVTRTTSGDISATLTFVRQHRVVGWEDSEGGRALHLASTSTYTVTGSGEAQGQHLELSGGGQRMRDVFVSAGGTLLSSVESDSSLVNANVALMGVVVPVRRSARTTMTRLP